MGLLIFMLFALVIVWAVSGGRTPSFLGGRVLKLDVEEVDLDVSVRRLAVRESGQIDDTLNSILAISTTGYDDVTTHHVTEYTVWLPEWAKPLHVADSDSVRCYHLKAQGSPATSDEIFNADFWYLKQATPAAAELLQIPQLRDMLMFISQSMGAVRIENGQLIFRDKGGTSKSEVGITKELIREMLDGIPTP